MDVDDELGGDEDDTGARGQRQMSLGKTAQDGITKVGENDTCVESRSFSCSYPVGLPRLTPKHESHNSSDITNPVHYVEEEDQGTWSHL